MDLKCALHVDEHVSVVVLLKMMTKPYRVAEAEILLGCRKLTVVKDELLGKVIGDPYYFVTK